MESYTDIAVSSLIGLIVTVGLPVAVKLFFDYLEKKNIVIDREYRDLFQEGLRNAGLRVAAKAGGPLATSVPAEADLEAAVEQVKKGAGDAVRHFEVSDAEIKARIRTNAETILQSSPTLPEILEGVASGAVRTAGGPLAGIGFDMLMQKIRRG